MTDVIVIFILGNTFPFYPPPPNSPKNENFKTMKKNTWRYHHFTIVPKIMIIYMLYWSWDMAHVWCNCYFQFWAMFCPFTPLTTQKMKTSKKWKKNTWRYHHLTQVYHKSWSYAILFLRYGMWWMQLFFILDYFVPFTPLCLLFHNLMFVSYLCLGKVLHWFF